jgi:hypothetical protein
MSFARGVVVFVAVMSLAPAARADENTPYKPDSKFHGYIGASVAGVLPGVWQSTGVGAEAGVRAGLVSDEVQIDFFASPGSSFLANANGCCSGDNVPSLVFFHGGASAAYLIKLSDAVYWPIRVGVGGGAMIAPLECFGQCGTTATTATFGFVEVKLDVVGALIRTSRHFMVQMEIPSVRVFVVPQGTSLIAWNTTLEVAYVF